MLLFLSAVFALCMAVLTGLVVSNVVPGWALCLPRCNFVGQISDSGQRGWSSACSGGTAPSRGERSPIYPRYAHRACCESAWQRERYMQRKSDGRETNARQNTIQGNTDYLAAAGLIRLPGTNRIDLQLTAHGGGFYRVGGAIRVTQGPNAGILGEVVEVEDPDFEATRGSKDEHHVRLDDGRVVVCQGRQIAPEWLPVHRGEGWIHHDELDGKRWPEYVALETTDARHDWPAVAIMPKRWRAVLGNEQWHDTSGVVTFSNVVPAIQGP